MWWRRPSGRIYLNILVLTSIGVTLLLLHYVHYRKQAEQSFVPVFRQSLYASRIEKSPGKAEQNVKPSTLPKDQKTRDVETPLAHHKSSFRLPAVSFKNGNSDTKTKTSKLENREFLKWDQEDERLINYIRTHHLKKPSTLPYNLSSGGQHPNGYSSHIAQFFRSKDKDWKGTFIEAGAYDGEAASNSLYLEQLGWNGLLVECNPLLLPKLLAKNRKAWLADVCLSLTNTPQLINFTTLNEWPASAKIGRPLNAEEMTHHGLDWVNNKTWINYELTGFPLYSILKATNQFNEIDFFSLDVEGAEIEILKHFPFDKFKIKTMFVEVHTFSEKEKSDLRKFLDGKGYKLEMKAGNDDFYVLKAGIV